MVGTKTLPLSIRRRPNGHTHPRGNPANRLKDMKALHQCQKPRPANLKHVDLRIGLIAKRQLVQIVTGDDGVEAAGHIGAVVIGIGGTEPHDALYIARFGIDNGDVGEARVDDEDGVEARGVRGPADGGLVGDGDCFGEGDCQARVGDGQEGGAGVVQVGACDEEVVVVVVEEVEAEHDGLVGEGGQDGGCADDFFGLAVGVRVGLIGIFDDGEGVDEAWVFAVAADAYEECG